MLYVSFIMNDSDETSSLSLNKLNEINETNNTNFKITVFESRIVHLFHLFPNKVKYFHNIKYTLIFRASYFVSLEIIHTPLVIPGKLIVILMDKEMIGLISIVEKELSCA